MNTVWRSMALHVTKTSFAARASEAEARARAVERDAFELAGVSRARADARGRERGSMGTTSKRARATATTDSARETERHREIVRWMHASVERGARGCVIGDEAETEPIRAACAFASEMSARRRSGTTSAVLVLCAPNAVMAWTETLKMFGVGSVALVKNGEQARIAFERIEAGAASAAVMSHDVYRNVVEKAMDVDWIVCVYDEVHRLKSEKTKGYEAARLLHEKVYRVGLSDQLFSNCDSNDLWAVLNWIAPWQLGDRSLYNSYFVKPISEGHKGKHSDLATQRTRELHARLSTMITPGIGEAALYRQYVPEITGTKDDVSTAKRALEALAKFENLTVPEMAKKLLRMDRKARDALRLRVVASETLVGSFGAVLEQWRKEMEMTND